MRTSSLLQCAALVGAVYADHDAYMWTIDSKMQASSNQVGSTSSFDAERILARRKGVTETAYMDITDESLLAGLNQYGGWQQPLFGADTTDHPARIFVRISGYDGSVGDFNRLPDLWIEKPETTLLDTFEAKFDTKSICEYHITSRTKDNISIKYTYVDTSKSCRSQSEIESLPALLAITATVPTADSLSGKGISNFHRTLVHLSATDNIESTLLVLPTTSKLEKPKKSELKKRAEQPLELSTPKVTPEELSTFRSNSSSNSTLPRNIPQYFQSEAACNNQTNSCMGHGKCMKTHGNLYKCACGRTTVREHKTVLWGGNACQKKDVSSEFILFAGFGIFFTALVTGGIGMLFGMGAEQLPSVIGAGVVGPRAQR